MLPRNDLSNDKHIGLFSILTFSMRSIYFQFLGQCHFSLWITYLKYDYLKNQIIHYISIPEMNDNILEISSNYNTFELK